MGGLLKAMLAMAIGMGVLTGTNPASAVSLDPSAASPNATWRDCESYGKRARTGCLTGQTVQPWQKCPSSLVGWFTLTRATNALVECRKSGASTKWVWA
jgi:hypothetical protein